MWARGAAIRPVPSYAVVDRSVLDAVERDLSVESTRDRDERSQRGAREVVDLEEAFARFERTQPELEERVSTILGKPLDDTALSLGYFLTIAVWLAFERAFPGRLAMVSDEALLATDDALALEEELRADHAEEPLELDDIIAQEQPAIMEWVNEHLEAALERGGTVSAHAHAMTLPARVTRTKADERQETQPAEEDEHDIDIDDVHLVYRTVLVLALALSHAVLPAKGSSTAGAAGTSEMMA